MTSKPGACIHSAEGFKAIFDQKTKNVMTSHPNPLDDYRKVPAGASCLMLFGVMTLVKILSYRVTIFQI